MERVERSQSSLMWSRTSWGTKILLLCLVLLLSLSLLSLVVVVVVVEVEVVVVVVVNELVDVIAHVLGNFVLFVLSLYSCLLTCCFGWFMLC